MVLATVIFVLALFLTSLILLARNSHWWRVVLIGAIMSGLGAFLWIPGEYGPSDRLKFGIDLKRRCGTDLQRQGAGRL